MNISNYFKIVSIIEQIIYREEQNDIQIVLKCVANHLLSSSSRTFSVITPSLVFIV